MRRVRYRDSVAGIAAVVSEMNMRKIFLSLTIVALSLGPSIISVVFAQDTPQQRDPALVERGRYLVEIAANCGFCHATRGPDRRVLPGMNLAGGLVFSGPGFRWVAPNITPDAETGIGRWTDDQIVTAIREGYRPDGSLLGPGMPVEMYRQVSDRDLRAILAYLRTTQPVKHIVTERSTYSFPLTSYEPVASVAEPADNPESRGAYLAGPLAHCIGCHTPFVPNERRRDWSRTGAGGVVFEGPWGVVLTANITSDKEHGIGNWTDEQIIRAITEGVSANGRQLAPPMRGQAPVLARLSGRDLHDLIAYLRSLAPQKP